MPIKLNKIEQQRLDDELRSYPNYMKRIIGCMLENWSLDDNKWILTEDCPEVKELAHKRNFQEIVA